MVEKTVWKAFFMPKRFTVAIYFGNYFGKYSRKTSRCGHIGQATPRISICTRLFTEVFTVVIHLP